MSFHFPTDVRGWMNALEGETLYNLARDRVVLELGSYAGLSTLCMAQSASRVVACDTFDGRATYAPGLTFPEFWTNISRYGFADKVTALVGTSCSALPFLAPIFDMVFIDADHSYDAVLHDLQASVKLLKPGGILACHDYGMGDRPDVKKAIDDWRHKRPLTGLVSTVAWFALA
jgi:predicted O-methyltransferase YrrM